VSWYQLFLVHLEPMEEGVSPGAVEGAEELSQEEEEGELGFGGIWLVSGGFQ